MSPLLTTRAQIGGRSLAEFLNSHALVKTAGRRVARPVTLALLPRPHRRIKHVEDIGPLQYVLRPL